MKRNSMKGTGAVFRFTLADLCMSKGWLISTISIILLLLYGVPLLMYLIAAGTDEESSADAKISSVYICDETAGEVDYSYLTERGYEDAVYTAYHSVEDAEAAIKNADETLVVRITGTESDAGFDVTIYLPEETELSKSAANAYSDFFVENFDGAKQQKANASAEMTEILSKEIYASSTVLDFEGNPAESGNIAEELLLFLVPFFIVMVIYMMVLMYGQQLGNSILLEKTNKLMDTMLISIHPFALILGKLSAVVTSAVLQFMLWIFAGLGGFTAGFIFIAPTVLGGGAADTEAAAAGATGNLLLEMLSGEKYFSAAGIGWTLAIVVVGFLLYLSLAAISGALSSKPEDMSKTNIIFVMALVLSFFLCLNVDGGDDVSMISSAAWLNYFPFTAILVMPGKLLTGDFTNLQALISTICVLVASVLFVYIAAMLYKLLVLYRGNPPTPKQLVKMMKESRETAKKTEAAAEDGVTKE